MYMYFVSHGLSESPPGDGRSQSMTELPVSVSARETRISENQISHSVGDGNNGDSADTGTLVGTRTAFFAIVMERVWIRGGATRSSIGEVLGSASSGIVGKLCHSSEGVSACSESSGSDSGSAGAVDNCV